RAVLPALRESIPAFAVVGTHRMAVARRTGVNGAGAVRSDSARRPHRPGLCVPDGRAKSEAALLIATTAGAATLGAQRLRRRSASHCPLTGLRSRKTRQPSWPRLWRYRRSANAQPATTSARTMGRAMAPDM